jgi:hypothetical protein
MKKLCVMDFDGCLMNTPSPEEGKPMWSEKKGIPYPYAGWWGRAESLDTEVFDIKPFPNIHMQLKKDVVNPNAHVIILTSRLEKLRPQVEEILSNNGIVVDDVVLKRGNETKGDVILSYLKRMPDLIKIDIYDDFAGGEEKKIREFTDIKDRIPDGIEYNIYYVEEHGDSFELMESSNNILNIIQEELRNLKP